MSTGQYTDRKLLEDSIECNLDALGLKNACYLRPYITADLNYERALEYCRLLTQVIAEHRTKYGQVPDLRTLALLDRYPAVVRPICVALNRFDQYLLEHASEDVTIHLFTESITPTSEIVEILSSKTLFKLWSARYMELLWKHRPELTNFLPEGVTGGTIGFCVIAKRADLNTMRAELDSFKNNGYFTVVKDNVVPLAQMTNRPPAEGSFTIDASDMAEEQIEHFVASAQHRDRAMIRDSARPLPPPQTLEETRAQTQALMAQIEPQAEAEVAGPSSATPFANSATNFGKGLVFGGPKAKSSVAGTQMETVGGHFEHALSPVNLRELLNPTMQNRKRFFNGPLNFITNLPMRAATLVASTWETLVDSVSSYNGDHPIDKTKLVESSSQSPTISSFPPPPSTKPKNKDGIRSKAKHAVAAKAFPKIAIRSLQTSGLAVPVRKSLLTSAFRGDSVEILTSDLNRNHSESKVAIEQAININNPPHDTVTECGKGKHVARVDSHQQFTPTGKSEATQGGAFPCNTPEDAQVGSHSPQSPGLLHKRALDNLRTSFSEPADEGAQSVTPPTPMSGYGRDNALVQNTSRATSLSETLNIDIKPLSKVNIIDFVPQDAFPWLRLSEDSDSEDSDSQKHKRHVSFDSHVTKYSCSPAETYQSALLPVTPREEAHKLIWSAPVAHRAHLLKLYERKCGVNALIPSPAEIADERLTVVEARTRGLQLFQQKERSKKAKLLDFGLDGACVAFSNTATGSGKLSVTEVLNPDMISDKDRMIQAFSCPTIKAKVEKMSDKEFEEFKGEDAYNKGWGYAW